MRLLICIVLLVSPTKCRGEVDDQSLIKLIKQLEADAVEAQETRTLHMAQLTNTADEIDRAYQEFNRGTILGHGAALIGGNNYLMT